MTSVQNHRQLLNGSRLALLLIVFSLFSCGAFKKASKIEQPSEKTPDKKETEVITKNKEKSIIPINAEKEEKKEILEKTKVRFKGETYDAYRHNGKFKIAVLLPFHLNNQEGANRNRANFMLDYYNGMKLAIAELEKLSSTYNFHVFDTENDTNKLKTLLTNPILENVDLIIGPTSEDQVRLAAFFARKHQIPLVSPVSSLDQVWSENRFLIQLNSTAYAQAYALVNHIKNTHINQTIYVVRDGSKNDQVFGEEVVSLLKNEFKLNFKEITHSNFLKWEEYVNDHDNIVVIQTAEDKIKAVYTINPLVNRKGQVSLYASDKWLNFENVKYKQWDKIDLFIYSQRNDLATAPKAGKIKQIYRENYGVAPTDFVLLGYDQTLFLGELLNAFGKYFPLFIENKLFEYNAYNFRLSFGNNCFQNYGFGLLKFTESELIPVTLNYK